MPTAPSFQLTRPTLKLSWQIRTFSLVAGLVVLALLITARLLEPSGSGIGTHRQLGLPPCTSIVLFAMRCPACGMTTSWAFATRGQIVAAAETNLGGLMLALIAMAYVPASCYFCIKGTATPGQWFSLSLALALVVAMLVATIQWCMRLASG